MNSGDIEHALDRLRRASACDVSFDRRIAALEAAARRFLDTGDPLRREAEARLPEATGLSLPMVRECLPLPFGPISADAIRALVSDPARSATRAHDLVGIVSAGNVLAVALPKAVLALATGASCAVKLASGEPVLLPLFGRALAEADPEVGERFAAFEWRGGTRTLDEAFACGVDSLVAYGSDETVSTIGGIRRVGLVAHGTRVSLGIVRLGVDDVEAARFAARAATLYDQRGCLSPRTIFAIPGDRPSEFADHLAFELDAFASAFPLGRVPPEGATAIRRARDELEWAGGSARLRSGDGWTLGVSGQPEFRSGPGYRTLFLAPLHEPDDLAETLGPASGRIESAGVYPAGDRALRAAAHDAGIPRVVSLAEMQRPGLDWQQGGCSPLAGILRVEGS